MALSGSVQVSSMVQEILRTMIGLKILISLEDHILKNEPSINHAVREDEVTKKVDSTVTKEAEEKYVPENPKMCRCDRCPYETRYLSHLKDHMKGRHDKIRVNICDQCCAAYKHKKDLMRHQKCSPK